MMACDYCTDPDGASCVPYYGLGPHRHVGTSMIGSTVMEPQASWPTNYQEDPDEPGMGIWWCAHCGEGNPNADRAAAQEAAAPEEKGD